MEVNHHVQPTFKGKGTKLHSLEEGESTCIFWNSIKKICLFSITYLFMASTHGYLFYSLNDNPILSQTIAVLAIENLKCDSCALSYVPHFFPPFLYFLVLYDASGLLFIFPAPAQESVLPLKHHGYFYLEWYLETKF